MALGPLVVPVLLLLRSFLSPPESAVFNEFFRITNEIKGKNNFHKRCYSVSIQNT